jgi:hypothetical protein
MKKVWQRKEKKYCSFPKQERKRDKQKCIPQDTFGVPEKLCGALTFTQ